MNKYYYNSKPLLNKKVLGWFEELGYKKISGNEDYQRRNNYESS